MNQSQSGAITRTEFCSVGRLAATSLAGSEAGTAAAEPPPPLPGAAPPPPGARLGGHQSGLRSRYVDTFNPRAAAASGGPSGGGAADALPKPSFFVPSAGAGSGFGFRV
jgi:hypothetical protein